MLDKLRLEAYQEEADRSDYIQRQALLDRLLGIDVDSNSSTRVPGNSSASWIIINSLVIDSKATLMSPESQPVCQLSLGTAQVPWNP